MADKLFLRLVCIVQLIAVEQFILFASAEHDHDKEHMDAFQLSNGFLNELEVQAKGYPENITVAGISLLVENILTRTNCSGQTGLNATICQKCFDPDHLFDIVGATTDEGLNEDLYHEVSVVLLNTISSRYRTCLTQNTYEHHYASLVGHNGDDLTEEEFELILRNVSTIYDADIYYKCFTAEGTFDDIVANHTNGAKQAEVQELAGTVIYNLLRGYCIGESTAIDPEYFINEIFEMFAVDGVIPEEGFESMLESLGIGEEHHDESTNDPHDNHVHRKKRNVEKEVHDHDHDHDHDHEGHDDDHEEKKCYSGETLLDIFGIDHESGLNHEDLERICPALLQQVISKSCNEEHEEEETIKEEDDNAEVWGAGIGSAIIVSLASLCGVFIFPCIGKDAYSYVIQLLVALAVATLSGDAILHLLPQAFGLHSHGASDDTHDAHDTHGDEEHGPLSEELAFVWKGFAVMGAIYGFFLLEKMMRMLVVTHRPVESNHHNHLNDFPMKERKQMSASTTHLKEEGDDDESITGGFCERLSSMAIMILIGDTMHNFGDGLAIGAAYSSSMGAGVATSIAVLCHELPHEFGDFAVLLNSGLKFREALILNFLSALTAIVGVCVGIPVGENEEARQWIFAVVAGMFLYVALADMMPELMCPRKDGRKWFTFFLQNIGFLIGTATILLIALYEDSITIDI